MKSEFNTESITATISNRLQVSEIPGREPVLEQDVVVTSHTSDPHDTNKTILSLEDGNTHTIDIPVEAYETLVNIYKENSISQIMLTDMELDKSVDCEGQVHFNPQPETPEI